MIGRQLVVGVSGLGCILALSSAACSDDGPVDGRSGSVGGTLEASDAAIRDQVTRAAVFANRCSGIEGDALESCARDVASGASSDVAWAAWEGSVKTWSHALDHGAICRALDAHRGKTRLYWGIGVDLAGAQREIVFDVTKGQAAVFTYASSGIRNVLDADAGAYQAVGYATGETAGLDTAWANRVAGLNEGPGGIDLGSAATPWASRAIADGLVARLPAERAAAVVGLIGVDGAKYGDVPAVSGIGTHALSKALQGIDHAVDGAGGLLTFRATSSAGLGRGGSTAAAILRWAGPGNRAAVHVAVLAAALSEIETRHGGNLDAYCTSTGAALKGLSLTTGQLGPRAAGDAPIAIPDLPEPPKGKTAETSATPDCANDAELSCDVLYPGQNKVCSVNGTQHCCIAEAPVTQLCQKHEDCQALMKSATAQCVQVQNAPADGKFFTCQEPNPKKCSAIRAPRPEAGGICGDPAPYNATETYEYRNPYSSVETLKKKGAEYACDKADRAATDKCKASPYICTAHPSKPFHGEADCTVGVFSATCTCVSTVNCTYSWN